MAERLDDKELLRLKDRLMANSIQIDALAQLLIERGLVTENEFCCKLKQVQMEYEGNGERKIG